MKSVTRSIYDLNAELHHFFRTPLHILTQNDNIPQLVEKKLLYQTGSETLHHHHLRAQLENPAKTTTTLDWPDAYSYQFRNITLVGDEGNLFSNSHTWLKLCPSLVNHPPKKARRPLPLFTKTITEPTFHLTGRDSKNRCHFLFQHLPRLIAAEKILSAASSINILHCKGHETWQYDYIKPFLPNNTAINFIPCHEGTSTINNLLYIPQLRSCQQILSHPKHYRTINNQFNQNTTKTGSPLFISRVDAPDRHLLNEPEIIALVEKIFGSCEVIEFSKVSVAERIKKINQAPIVIGSQGQAFASILFTNRTYFIILEAGHYNSWCDHFADVGAICQNPTLTLYSTTERGKNQSYHFPIELAEKQFQCIKALINS
jgi:hypothetical protein